MKKVFSLLVVLVLMFSLVGCSDDDDGTTSPVASLQVNGGNHSADVTVGEDYSLPTDGTAIRENGNEEEVTIEWGGTVDTTSTGETKYSGTTSDVETDITIKFTVTVHPESGTEIDISDPSAPAAPTGIKSAKVSGEDGVTLSWDDTAAEYMVFRENKYDALTASAISDNQYNDYTAEPGEEYTYYIQSVGSNGQHGYFSDAVTQVAGGYEGVKIHYKYTGDGTPWLYAWVPGGEAGINGEWPGSAMTKGSNDWYVTSLSNYTNVGLKFTKEDKTSLTGDLFRSRGEWWYKDGQWYYTNPEK
mgnify:CR=1 FL=1